MCVLELNLEWSWFLVVLGSEVGDIFSEYINITVMFVRKVMKNL